MPSPLACREGRRASVRRRGLIAPALILALTAGVAAIALAEAQSPGSQAVAVFVAATREYAQVHRRIEQQRGPITVNADPATIQRAIDAMAAAMRAERPDAKIGDFFTPALAHELRARINDALLEHGFTAADVHTNERVQGVDPTTVRLRVNATFPWIVGTAMFPCVIEALPPLPPELQYRIVGNDLVLIDVHASLIVDILPNALADVTVRNFRPEGALR